MLELPEELRAELNRRLVASGFSNYDGLHAWLEQELDARGLELRVSRSAIHREGQKFEQSLEALRVATEQARAIAEASEDDEGAMNDALIRMVQTKTFVALRDLEDGAPLDKIGLMVARLTRASVASKKWMTEAREKLEVKKNAAMNAAEKVARRAGVSDDDWAAIRAQFLGIDVE
ncbi:MAG: DUF3486 family protein [Pseudomonadota bacterium]